jgi:hypothetical protein
MEGAPDNNKGPMHPTLGSLKSELAQLGQSVASIGSNEPLNIVHGNWSFPGTTRDELAGMATELVDLIDEFATEAATSNDALLLDYVRRIAFLRANTVGQIWSGNAALAVQAYETTLSGLTAAIVNAFGLRSPATKEEALRAVRKLKDLQTAIRAVETRVTSTDARSATLDQKIALIEKAHQTAIEFPTDLETLAESRVELASLREAAQADKEEASKVLAGLKELCNNVQKSGDEAAAILARCDAAYRASTSEGLASAFAQRSRSLSISMWVWVIGLVGALSLGAYFGTSQLQHLMSIARYPNQNGVPAELWVNLFLALFSVAGPVWFAWISTKQIGQRFRLAEDYGYKSSISKAYEGYRREAALLDPAFQSRLFSSALSRLDELPLRLVEAETHGSPWHELASSGAVRDALNTVPGFVEKVTSLADLTLSKIAPRKAVVSSSERAEKSADSEKS